MIQFTQLPELSLYIHLPWCMRKCPYCDFNSHEYGQGHAEGIPEEAYVAALLADLEHSLPMVWGRPITSVFIGGGTPSLFSPNAITRLLSEVRARLRLLPDCEITLEANPGTFEAKRFEGFRDAGVTRLSLGVQSFDDGRLRLLGRVHDRTQAIAAATLAARIFPRLNIDLMFGLPGQDEASLNAELGCALELGATHLSCYQLTLEPNTLFALTPPEGLPDDDRLADMQLQVVDRLDRAGLVRYEVSGFAVPGQECQHNLNYWTFGDYLGIGAGAHGKISFADRIVRTSKTRHPDTYLKQWTDDRLPGLGRPDPVLEPIPQDALPFEFMLNALRLIQGVPVSRWRETTGMDVGTHPFLLERIGRAQAKGLLSSRPGVFQATARGLELLSDLQSLFLK